MPALLRIKSKLDIDCNICGKLSVVPFSYLQQKHVKGHDLASKATTEVWCDWLLCHSLVWNPPPSCMDYKVGPEGDAWSRMASLVNLLEKLPHNEVSLITEPREGYEMVKLPEDATLYGFTPLMSIAQEPVYISKDADMEEAQIVLRIRKIIFFGTVYLCGIDPPVLKLQKYDTGHSEYISIVTSCSQQSSYSPLDEQSDTEFHLESFSEDEGLGSGKGTEEYPDLSSDNVSTPEEIRTLLNRKEELEKRHQYQEKLRKRQQAILENIVSIEIEVKPRNLVPDTNCFIDYIPQLQKITQAKSVEQQQPLYNVIVPLVVLKELEGLARGGKDRDFIPLPEVSHEHAMKVAEKAKAALNFLRSKHPGVRCVTTKGAVLGFTSCVMDEDTDPEQKNDDRILNTCLSLCNVKESQIPGEPRLLRREVVLLTEDRNLRVKALARYVPVREVPDFIKWADLG